MDEEIWKEIDGYDGMYMISKQEVKFKGIGYKDNDVFLNCGLTDWR